MEDNKYVVFKREDWDKAEGQEDWPWWENLVTDAVVIRRQDIFSAPALDAYANSIRAALAVLEHDGGPSVISGQLQDIADYFSEQAAKAWIEQRKLPD